MTIAESLADHPSVEDVKSQVQELATKNEVEEVQNYTFMDGSRLEVRARPGEEASVQLFLSPHEALSQ